MSISQFPVSVLAFPAFESLPRAANAEEDVSSLCTVFDEVSSRTARAPESPVAAPGVAGEGGAGDRDADLDCLLRSTWSSALRLGGMAGESPANAAAAAAAASEFDDPPSDCPCEVAASSAPRSRLLTWDDWLDLG